MERATFAHKVGDTEAAHDFLLSALNNGKKPLSYLGRLCGRQRLQELMVLAGVDAVLFEKVEHMRGMEEHDCGLGNMVQQKLEHVEVPPDTSPEEAGEQFGITLILQGESGESYHLAPEGPSLSTLYDPETNSVLTLGLLSEYLVQVEKLLAVAQSEL